MLKKIADNRDENSLAVQFRRKRFAFFLSLLSQLKRLVSILDMGAAQSYWKTMEMYGEDQVFITLLNVTKEEMSLPNITSVVGDAGEIKYDNNSFDVVFSNSVIEHVGSHADQVKMANEVRRVGKRYFIKTPRQHFPIEPHFRFPFFHFLPVIVQVRLLQNFNLGWLPRTPESAKARKFVERIRLLGRHEFFELFPASSLYKEKAFGMTKSFVAYGGWNAE